MLPASHGSQCLQRRQAVSTVNPSPWLFIIIIIIISASSLFLGVIYHRQVDLGRCLYVLILRVGSMRLGGACPENPNSLHDTVQIRGNQLVYSVCHHHFV